MEPSWARSPQARRKSCLDIGVRCPPSAPNAANRWFWSSVSRTSTIPWSPPIDARSVGYWIARKSFYCARRWALGPSRQVCSQNPPRSHRWTPLSQGGRTRCFRSFAGGKGGSLAGRLFEGTSPPLCDVLPRKSETRRAKSPLNGQDSARPGERCSCYGEYKPV